MRVSNLYRNILRAKMFLYFMVYGSRCFCFVHRELFQQVTRSFLSMYLGVMLVDGLDNGVWFGGLPLQITFFSTHHSPSTVKRKANELVIGTVRLNSIIMC